MTAFSRFSIKRFARFFSRDLAKPVASWTPNALNCQPLAARLSSSCTLLCAVLFGLLPSLPAMAGNRAETPQVKAELLAAVDTVYPGETIRLAVRQQIIPHWHTYWINPGDSGLATSIAWTLPEGAQAGAIDWPVPSRFKLGPIGNYGYENEATLLTSIKLPETLRPGGEFRAKASVDWLVCREECIPQHVDLELALPVAAPGTPRRTGNRLIEQAEASLPAASPWRLSLARSADGLLLRAQGAGDVLKTADVWFYADAWGKTSHGDAQVFRQRDDGFELQIKAGEEPAAVGSRVGGMLAIRQADGRLAAYRVDAAVAPAGSDNPAAPSAREGIETGAALLLALLGGLILNLMPCVFPVLSIKALALLKHVHQPARQTRLQGLAYTAGVLASFAGLAAALIAIKAGGAEVGWGFQFQSPLFVLGVAYLMFAVGLSLSGVFTFGAGAGGLGASLAERHGYLGSFFTGVLATVVATPCTAPFMGAALGFALTQPAPVLLAVFLSLGLGLALPYLLLSFWPGLQRLLPRPGPWMEGLKEGLAFPMYGAAAWLVWVLAQQGGPNAIAVALGGMVGLAFAAWLFERSRQARPPARRLARVAALVALLATGAVSYLGSAGGPDESTVADKADWEVYSQARFDALRAAGTPVFVNFTAAWCITCLANEKVALSNERVRAAFRQAGIVYLKGDWTRRDPQISAHLADFGRSGVPLYLFYPGRAEAEARVLPQLLTPDIVLAHLDPSALNRLVKE